MFVECVCMCMKVNFNQETDIINQPLVSALGKRLQQEINYIYLRKKYTTLYLYLFNTTNVAVG